jgi:tetratricopeptide (TPR) repeat protein
MPFPKFSFLIVSLLLNYSFCFSKTIKTNETEIIKAKRDSLTNTYLKFFPEQTNEVIENLHKALEINKVLDDDTINAFCFYGLGRNYRVLGNLNLSIQYQEKAKNVYDNLNIAKGIISTSNELALLHKSRGEYNIAVDYYLNAIKLAEETNNEHIGELYHNLALMYGNMGNDELSLKYLKSNLDVKKDSALHFGN